MELSTHAARLDRWLGPGAAERASKAMRGWYGPPIAVGGVPGRVFVDKHGDFHGRITRGEDVSALERAHEIMARAARVMPRIRRAAGRIGPANMGFSSFSDLLSEVTGNGKTHTFALNKAGPTGVAAVTSTLWRLGTQPAAGAVGAAAPGGTAHSRTDTGAFNDLVNVSTDTQHFISGNPIASVVGNTLLLYDRLFAVAKTMNATTTEAVTGVPTRYQSTTSSNPDYIGGNFGFIEVGGTALAATAHNWTVCKYTNQGGTTGVTLPSVTGNSAAIVDRLDHPVSQWFLPLASGDWGLGAWSQMQCSAAVATGVISFCIGHPIVMMPCPVANMATTVDGLTTAFNMVRIFDSACLALLEISKPTTTATTYTGTFQTVWG